MGDSAYGELFKKLDSPTKKETANDTCMNNAKEGLELTQDWTHDKANV